MRLYMQAFQGKAMWQCANDLAYVCVTCARACDCSRWITLECSGIFLFKNYSRLVKQCVNVHTVYVCVVIIPLCNVIHRVWMISSGTSGNTDSMLEELCLYGERRRGFWEKKKVDIQILVRDYAPTLTLTLLLLPGLKPNFTLNQK